MMTIEGSVIALAVFMIINSITPGPNNIMLLQGGLKRGYWGCRWHMLGVSFGVGIMLWLSYWGMAAVIVNHPTMMLIIKILGTSYLLWLAYHMAKSNFAEIVRLALESKDGDIANKQRFGELPLSFWEAVLFQWLNPKAWTMTMVAPTLAILTSNVLAVQLGQLKFGLNNWPLLIMCMAINLICISFWSAGGQQLRRLVTKPLTMRLVHGIIVLMVVYCAVALWF